MKGLIPFGTKKVVLVHAIGIRQLETMRHGLAHFLEPHLVKQKAFLQDLGFETETVLAPGPAVIEVNRIAKDPYGHPVEESCGSPSKSKTTR